jgi:hypothetical protein
VAPGKLSNRVDDLPGASSSSRRDLAHIDIFNALAIEAPDNAECENWQIGSSIGSAGLIVKY